MTTKKSVLFLQPPPSRFVFFFALNMFDVWLVESLVWNPKIQMPICINLLRKISPEFQWEIVTKKQKLLGTF